MIYISHEIMFRHILNTNLFMVNISGEFQRPSLLKMASTKLSRFQAGFEARASNWQWSKSGGAWRGYMGPSNSLWIHGEKIGKIDGKTHGWRKFYESFLLYQRSGKSKPEANVEIANVEGFSRRFSLNTMLGNSQGRLSIGNSSWSFR